METNSQTSMQSSPLTIQSLLPIHPDAPILPSFIIILIIIFEQRRRRRRHIAPIPDRLLVRTPPASRTTHAGIIRPTATLKAARPTVPQQLPRQRQRKDGFADRPRAGAVQQRPEAHAARAAGVQVVGAHGVLCGASEAGGFVVVVVGGGVGGGGLVEGVGDAAVAAEPGEDPGRRRGRQNLHFAVSHGWRGGGG
ncbi:hypothetical protein HDK64DRAFT_100306 [Phyllosticta capitalensis]